MTYRLLSVLFFLCFTHQSVLAQVTYDGCSDFRGIAVASIQDNSVNDVAMAIIENGRPVIRYNTQVLAMMSAPTRRFFYVHECAHHALAHTAAAASLQNERQADCWAAKTMRSQLGFSRQEIQAVVADIGKMGRADWTHLPGQYRIIDISQCYGADGDSDGVPPAPPSLPRGFPSGYGMQICGCWGGYPGISSEPRCQSGYAIPAQCQGGCPGGGSPYGFVCQ